MKYTEIADYDRTKDFVANIDPVQNIHFTQDQVTITSGNFFNCKFESVTAARGAAIRFENCEIEKIELEHGNFNFIKCGRIGSIRSTEKANLIVDNCDRIELLELFHVQVSKIVLTESVFRTLKFQDCGFGALTIYSCIVNELFWFIRSQFSTGCKIERLNLREAKLEMFNSAITSQASIVISFPKDYRIVEEVDGKSLMKITDPEDLVKLREAYRVLKTVALRDNNKLDARRFQTNEIRMHSQELTILRWRTKRNTQEWWQLYLDKAIMTINEKVSDYGESFTKPLMYLSLTSLVYLLIQVNTLHLGWFEKPDRTITLKAFGYYFNFFNPVHASKLMDAYNNEVDLSGTADFFMRLISGFLVFHILRATRKYSVTV